MKNCFTKVIFALLIISMIPMLGGFCVFQFSLFHPIKINEAQAATISSNSGDVNNVAGHADSCGAGQQADNNPVQASASVPASHGKTNSLLPCCVDGGHSIISSIQPVKLFNSVPVIIPQEKTPILSEPQIIFASNQNISPPSLSITKTVILRL